MCVECVKFTKEYGWIGCKNRDRNYKPKIRILQSFKDNVESLIIYDELTTYSEGVNEFGVSILNTATAVDDDENAAQDALRAKENQATLNNPDGLMLRRALKFKTPKDTAEYLAKTGLIGHTVVFNKDECWILEGGMSEKQFNSNREAIKKDPKFVPPKIDYTYTLRQVPKDEVLIRTNHGIDLPWLGYQNDTGSEKQTLSRESSEARLAYATENCANVKTPEELIDALAKTDDENPQLNTLRLGDYNKKSMLKTSCQICLVPAKKEMIYVPYWCEVTNLHNINNINNVRTKTYLSIRSRSVSESFKDYLKSI